jgi:23S rRNA (uracil1939-C5)-methyltransferase
VVPVRECPVHDPRGNAPAFHFRDAIEESTLAVADGEASRALNGIPPARCRFIARPVEHALAGGLRTGGLKAAGYRPDVVVLDPPREGCTAAVVRKVFGGLRPARAIYISCNPEALARDLALIAARGYTIQSLQPVDMFPHTAHVETVAILAR